MGGWRKREWGKKGEEIPLKQRKRSADKGDQQEEGGREYGKKSGINLTELPNVHT